MPLPLTVLVHDGPMARAYLAVLRHAGLLPERILLLVYKRAPGSVEKIGKWLPTGLRRRYAERVQDIRFNYWARHLRKRYPQVFDEIADKVAGEFGLPRRVVEEISAPGNYEQYTDCLDRIFVNDMADPALGDFFSRLGSAAVLYTGGGILSKSLLSLPGLRFLHVHPAILPNVRGADGLMWGTLVRGNPGASCFYMARGIDTGDIIETREYSLPTFRLDTKNRLDDEMLYRMVFSYYDPLMRADLAVRVLERGGDIMNLSSSPQNLETGLSYPFMSLKLRKAALERIFPPGG